MAILVADQGLSKELAEPFKRETPAWANPRNASITSDRKGGAYWKMIRQPPVGSVYFPFFFLGLAVGPVHCDKGVSSLPSRMKGSRAWMPSAGANSRTQMLRKRTGFPWS